MDRLTAGILAMGLAVGICAPVWASAAGEEAVARGAVASLTRDNAAAFHEALQFALEQVGAQNLLSQATENQVVAALAQQFPLLPLEDQMVLANARALWNQAQANWQGMPPAQQRQFVFDVLRYGIGEQAAAELLGVGQSGGGQPGVSGYDSTVSGLPSMDAGYEGQGCWASAGCTDYDAGSDTYTYESYDSYSGSYESY